MRLPPGGECTPQRLARHARTASELDAGRAAIGVFTPVTASLWIARLQREAEATLPPAPRTGPVPPAPLDVHTDDSPLGEVVNRLVAGIRAR